MPTTDHGYFNFIDGPLGGVDDNGNTLLTKIQTFQNAVDDALYTFSGGASVGLPDPGANGIIVRDSVGHTIVRSLTQPSAGLTISNNDGVSGNPTFALANDLAALEGLSGTGRPKRTGTDTWSLAAIDLSSEVTGSLPWASVDKTGSSLADLATRSAGDLNSGTLSVARGGTGSTTALGAFNSLSPLTTQGDVLYFDGSNNVRLAKTASVTRYLSNTGSSNNPAWAQVDLTNGVTGILPVGSGGSGGTSFTANGVLYGNGISALGVTASPTSDYMVLAVQSGIPVFTNQPNVQIMQLGVGSSTTGDLRLANSTNSNLLHIQSGINTGAWTMTMPTSAGTIDYVLRTDGGGIMSWISGQSIAGLKTTSSPEFSDLTLSGANPANGFLKVGTYNIIPGAIGINVAGVTTAHNQSVGAYIEGSDLSWSGVGPNTTVTTAVTGVYSIARTHLNSAPITILYSIEGDAIIHNATSVDRAYGVYALVDINTSTITQRAVGVRSNVTLANANTIPLAIGFKGTQTISTGTVTDVRGLDLSEWSASSTVTTSYGIYIDSSIDIGTTKYAVYSTSLSNSLLQGGLSLGVAGTTLGLLKLNGNTSGTITINGAAAAGTWTLTLPTGAGTSGYVLSTNGSGVTSWIAQSGGGSGASTALDNLASVAINASLLPGTDNAIDLGSTSKYWRDVFVKGNLKSRDTSAAFDALLAFTSSTVLTANRIFTIDLVNAARTLKLTGNPTIADWFDQSVKTTASPTFAALTLTAALAVAQGGTGSTTAAGARSNLSAAASGGNSDITNLTGLTGAVQIASQNRFRYLQSMARATNASGTQTINSGTITVVTFATEDYDTDGIHSTSSNTSRMTAAIAGKHRITGGVQWSAQTLGVTTVVAIFLTLNGTTIPGSRQYQAPITSFATFGQGIAVSVEVNLVAGDYVELNAYHDRTASGTLTLDSAASALSMEYIGE